MDIKSVQTELKKQKITARLFTLGNMFINEDILDSENRILELTNFTGSYGIFLVTQTKSYLFIDGRYEIQASREVNLKKVELVKLSTINFFDWLKQNFAKSPIKISYNPWVISISYLKKLSSTLPNATFIPIEKENRLVSDNKVKVFTHSKKYTGYVSKDKIADFARFIKKQGLDAYLITSASNSSWLLNHRSNALQYTPIFRAYVLVEKTGSYKVFAHNTDFPKALSFDTLKDHIANYEKIASDFKTTPSIISSYNSKLTHKPDEITNLKSIKNSTELKGTKNAHIRDGVAVCKFLYWLSKNYKEKTEMDLAQKLLSYRKKELNFHSESFATIAGFGENSAVIHYHATPKTNATIKKNSVLLLDSGAQYYDGTTDVTRTIAIGTPSSDMIEKNTLVLKAHIAIASSIFPKDTCGNELDLIARQSLLKNNLDYEHGTGHGVGLFSNVHEGPCSISIKAKNSAPLKPGMVTSIEPGVYKEKLFGIRIENLYYVKQTKNPKYLSFEVLTLIPLDKTLINKYMLTPEEIAFVNNYHHQVFLSLKKYLTKQELEWLKASCSPL